MAFVSAAFMATRLRWEESPPTVAARPDLMDAEIREGVSRSASSAASRDRSAGEIFASQLLQEAETLSGRPRTPRG